MSSCQSVHNFFKGYFEYSKNEKLKSGAKILSQVTGIGPIFAAIGYVFGMAGAWCHDKYKAHKTPQGGAVVTAAQTNTVAVENGHLKKVDETLSVETRQEENALLKALDSLNENYAVPPSPQAHIPAPLDNPQAPQGSSLADQTAAIAVQAAVAAAKPKSFNLKFWE